MGEPSHRRALFLEIGTMLGSSYTLGAIVALAAALVVVPLLDPLQTVPPAPIFVVPGRTILGILAALAAVSWAGAWFMGVRSRARALGEVLRIAD